MSVTNILRSAIYVSAILSTGALAASTGPEISDDDVAAALPRFQQLVSETMARTGLPGAAIGVVYKDEVVLLEGYGVRQLGGAEPVDPDTVFQLASVSKPIAATVIAAAVGQKTVGWDDPVIDHLPDFQLADPWITRNLSLRDLLCHRSGLPDHAGDLLEDLGYDRREVLHRLRFLRPLGRFRQDYAYTNFGFTAAAEAVARAAATSWADLSSELLYQPLGMRATSSRHADYRAAENRAVAHVLEGGVWRVSDQRQPDAQSPAGGVTSSARDMAQLIRLQLGRGRVDGVQLVDETALAETHTPQVITGYDATAGRISTYALGWNVGINPLGLLAWSHSGAFGLGIRSEVVILPDVDLGIVVLTNGAPTGIPEGLTISFMELLIDGKTSRDWIRQMDAVVVPQLAPKSRTRPLVRSDPPAAPQASAVYVGRYENPYYGVLEIIDQDGQLQMMLGPEPKRFRLDHWDRDVFLYQPTGENAGAESAVVFTVDGTGEADRVRVEHLDNDGLGSFQRRREALDETDAG